MNFKRLLALMTLVGLLLFTACSDDDNNHVDYDYAIMAICDSLVANSPVPSIVIQIKAPDKNIDLLYATGMEDLEQQIEIRTNQTHRIGSITKTFVVTVLLQLIDEELLTLETKLDNYYPQIPEAESITMEMLTDMTSGLKNYMEAEEFYTILEGEMDHYFAPDSLINISIRAGADFAPGADWHYSNTNTILIGRIIEMITGNTLKNELENRIFENLGMTETVFLNEGTTIPGDSPQGYYAGEVDSLMYNMTEVLDISMAWAAGSIVSSMADMQKYLNALVDGDLLSSEMQQLRLSCQNQVTEKPIKYGLGMADYQKFFGHNGSFPGFTTSCYKSPDKDCSIIIFFNCQLDENVPDMLFEEITAMLYDDICWE